MISFLLPVIALSGSNLKPVVVPAELIFGALDGTGFHHCQTLTRSDLMLSVRAPDDSPLRLVLWQEQLCKLPTLLACLSQGASSSSMKVNPTGCRSLQLSLTTEEVGRKNADLSVSRSQTR